MKNPSKGGEVALREPREILEEMRKLDKDSDAIIDRDGCKTILAAICPFCPILRQAGAK